MAVATRDTTVDNYVADVPSGKAVIGVHYTAPFGLSTFLAVKTVLSIVRTADVRSGNSPGWNGRSDFQEGYTVVDLNLQQPLGRHSTVRFGINNLFNTPVYYLQGANPADNRILSLSLEMRI